MTIACEEIRYSCEGTSMQGRVYRDPSQSGDRPAVLVYPEFFGISQHTYERASRLAELGYVAMACDLHGEAWYSGGTTDELKQRAETLFFNKPRIHAIGRTAMDALREQGGIDGDRLAAIGYCFGGQIALELAFAGEPLAAAVAFHPSLDGVTSSNADKARARLLLCIGTDDPMASPEARARFEADLKGSSARWQMNLYGSVKHGFTNPNSAAPPELVVYDEWADHDSWRTMTALLGEVFA